MSDDVSDDDLANNYGPTTPAPPKRTRAPRATGSKPLPGPSTKPPSKTAVSKNKATNQVELDEDEEEVVVVEPTKKRRKGSEEIVVVAAPAPVKAAAAKKTAGRPSSLSNGVSKAATATTKGKARAEHPPDLNGIPEEAMDVDDKGDIVEEEPPDPPVPRGGRATSKQVRGKNGAVAGTPVVRQAKADAKLVRETERLRAQLEQAQEEAKQIAAQRDKLAGQLEEFHRIRHTETEQALSDYKAHYDESVKRKEGLIQELTNRVGKLQHPSKSGSSYTLHFLTREAAEEEKRALQDENSRLKDNIKQRDATITEKEQQIAALNDEVKTIKRELDAEIERSKTLASRAPAPTASRSTKPMNAESHATVVKLYEDMTNILITNVKFERSEKYPDVDEEHLSCLYSYNNSEENISFSLGFSLRSLLEKPDDYPPDEPITKDKLVRKMMFQPKDLEKERSEVVERLQFFKEPFLFARSQMTVFLKTLTDTITSMFESDETAEGESGDNVITIVDD